MNLMKRVFVVSLIFVVWGCSTTYPNQKILGQPMIEFMGENLNEEVVALPKDLLGDQLLMLIGYKQESQFDIDRWLIGLDMTQTKINVIEVPAIQGFFPSLIKNTINEGMRKGIPDELWKIVVTVYEDGDKIQKFTGNTNPNNARVVLIDATGNIEYFYDRGFSVDALNQLRQSVNVN